MYLLGFADPSGQRTNIKPIIDPRTGFPVVTKPKISKSSIPREPATTSAPRRKKAKDGVKIEKEKGFCLLCCDHHVL